MKVSKEDHYHELFIHKEKISQKKSNKNVILMGWIVILNWFILTFLFWLFY